MSISRVLNIIGDDMTILGLEEGNKHTSKSYRQKQETRKQEHEKYVPDIVRDRVSFHEISIFHYKSFTNMRPDSDFLVVVPLATFDVVTQFHPQIRPFRPEPAARIECYSCEKWARERERERTRRATREKWHEMGNFCIVSTHAEEWVGLEKIWP